MITSKTNEQIKYIASLKEKKYREEYSKYILEGIKLVDELSSGENPPELIVYCEELLKTAAGGYDLLNKLPERDIELLQVSEMVFRHLSDTVSPQGILAIMKIKSVQASEIESKIEKNETFIILDRIQDQGNLGTIIRSCVAFNIDNIICLKGTADVYSSKIVRSTMGAINKLNIFYLDSTELTKIIQQLKLFKYEIVGTSLDADENLGGYIPTLKTVYVMGNEANGMSDDLKSLCDVKIKIEMDEIQESLNVSTATSILLYKMYIQNN